MLKIEKMAVVLKSLHLENFKCFKKNKVINFEKLTIITGANSSGKSSLLHGILGAIQSGEFPYKFSTNGKYVNMGDFKEVSHNHNGKEIKIGLDFFSSDTDHTYSFKTTWKNSSINFLPEIKEINLAAPFLNLNITHDIKENEYLLSFNYDPRYDPNYKPETEQERKQALLRGFVTRNQVRGNKKKLGIEFKKFKSYVETMFKKSSIKNLRVKDMEDIEREPIRRKNLMLDYTIDALMGKMIHNYDEHLNVISSFRHHPDRTYLEQSKDKLKVDKFGDGYLDQIILWEKRNKPKWIELQSIMKKLKLVHSISAHRIEGGRFEVLVTTKENGTKTSLFDVGFGISQFLPIIVADLQLPNGSTLIVAEPEIHLHPNVQAEFGDYLCEQIVKNDKNYILETHSEYLLNRLRLAIVKGTLKEADLAVYYLDNEGEDINIHKLKFGKQGQIENAPDSFFDTYLMDIKDIALSVE